MDFNGHIFAFAVDFTKGCKKVDAGLHILLGHRIGRRNESIDFDQRVDFPQDFNRTVGQAAQLLRSCIDSNNIVIAGKNGAGVSDYDR